MTYKLNRQRQNKITIANLIVIFWLLFLPFLASSQTKKIVGTYTYSDEEYLQIDLNNFKIIRTENGLFSGDMDEGDSVIAFGRVENINNDFIKLISYKYDLDVYNSTIFTESHDKSLSDDSIKIRFNFPLKGEFKIYFSFSNGYKFVSVNSKIITIPKGIYLTPMHFDIYKTDILVYNFSSNYLGPIVFSYFPSYEFKNENLNLLNVTIPNLTNSYYARYYIDGEYAKIEGNKIIWRNREYEKISDSIIDPPYYYLPEAIDDTSRVHENL